MEQADFSRKYVTVRLRYESVADPEATARRNRGKINDEISKENAYIALNYIMTNNGYSSIPQENFNWNASAADFNKEVERYIRRLGGQTLVDEWQRELKVLNGLMGLGKAQAGGRTLSPAETMELARQQREQLATILGAQDDVKERDRENSRKGNAFWKAA